MNVFYTQSGETKKRLSLYLLITTGIKQKIYLVTFQFQTYGKKYIVFIVMSIISKFLCPVFLQNDLLPWEILYDEF